MIAVIVIHVLNNIHNYRSNNAILHLSSFSVSIAMHNIKTNGVESKKKSADTMNITTSTKAMSNGSLDISSFLPSIEIETSDSDWSSPNEVSDHTNNLLPDFLSDFEYSLPNFNSSQNDKGENENSFPDFDLDLSSFINTTSDDKNVSLIC